MIPYVHVADPGFIHPFGILVATGVLIGIWLAVRWRDWMSQQEAARWAWMNDGVRWGFGLTLLLLAAVLSPGGEKPPFIYFQF